MQTGITPPTGTQDLGAYHIASLDVPIREYLKSSSKESAVLFDRQVQNLRTTKPLASDFRDVF
jgi:hypothetical protein